MSLTKKELFQEEFSKTMRKGDHQYLSFYGGIGITEEFDILFKKIMSRAGTHFPIYRMCDAEYMYCVGRQIPPHLSLPRKLKYRLKTFLVNSGIITQRTGHANTVNKEMWFGETYTLKEKKIQKEKFLNDLRQIGKEGYLSPHLVYSKSHFAEEYIQPMLSYFQKNNIPITKESYFPFYFVYLIMSLDRYKDFLYRNKNVLIVTAFNERNKQENFTKNLAAEGVKNVYFYNISHDKSMLEVVDKTKLPAQADLVLIGAGIGSANIMNQLSHLNALCIDAGHALDCISRPQLRLERIFLIPDEHINEYVKE